MGRSKKGRGGNRLSKLFKSLDFFDEKPSLTVDGEQSYQTVFGASLSLVALFLVCLYGFDRFIVLR